MLFVQGGGAGTYDEWDNKLVASLRHELGEGFEVRYPRMPGEDDPSGPRWSAAIRSEMAALDDGAVVAGHSVGATILVRAIAEQPPQRRLGGIVLIAAPFIGEGGWPGEPVLLPPRAPAALPPRVPAASFELGAFLPPGVPVAVFHGLEDETVPPSHARRYGEVIPYARVWLLPGRDHQLGDDLREVAEAISGW